MSKPVPAVKEAVFENIRLVWPNFEGRVEKFNTKGDRSFVLPLGDPLHAEPASAIINDGWGPIKNFREDEEGTPGEQYIKVGVRWDIKPPTIVLLTSNTRTRLSAETSKDIDKMDILMIDVILVPFAWEIEASGAAGIKAYLKSAYITLNEDFLERKYGYVPDDSVAPEDGNG